MRLRSIALVLSALLVTSPAYSGGADPYFNSVTGKVVIPRIQIGAKLYYAELVMTDSKTLSFAVNLGNLLDVTPAVGALVPSATALVGSWVAQSAHSVTVTFNADGTYTFIQTPSVDDPKPCEGTGTTETGTYNWDPNTGIFVTHVVTDQNGDCGFSKDQGIRLFLVSGSTLVYRAVTDHVFKDTVLVPN